MVLIIIESYFTIIYTNSVSYSDERRPDAVTKHLLTHWYPISYINSKAIRNESRQKRTPPVSAPVNAARP